jgi:gluconate 2-dehydrogenase gamma chain
LTLAGQGPSRRELLQALTLASAASAFSGFSRWNFAFAESNTQHHHSAAIPAIVNPVYRPQFFSSSQYRTVELLADLILPPVPPVAGAASSKPQPGAREAGVAEFIDFMVFSDSTLQEPFRDGLQWLDRASAPAVDFGSLTAVQQNALLERLAYKAKQQESEKAGQQFFLLVRKYTVMGFYTTRDGLESLGYPGLTFYATSPGCTHAGNPEHVGL